jgi:hypothetical protein
MKHRFDRVKIRPYPEAPVLEATTGQLRFEWSHLMEKLRRRAPELALRLAPVHKPDAHPLFRVIPGPVSEWERVKNNSTYSRQTV